MKKTRVVSIPYRKTIYFSIVLSLLFVLLFSLQSCEEAIAPEIDGNINTSLQKSVSSRQKKGSDMTLKEKEEFTNTLKDIAKGLAILFKEESNKKLLETAIKTSKKKEQILEASEFLNLVKDIKVNGSEKNITFREAIADVLPTREKELFISKINTLPFGLVDIFFPIKEYRDNWKSNDNLQVAALGWNEAIKDKEATCYSLDGDEFVIPTNEKPLITTLVVYPSEKLGNYSLNSTYQNLKKNNSISSTNYDNPGYYSYKYKVKWIKITNEYDDWLEGATMEIFFEYKIDKTGSGYTGWTSSVTSGEVDCEEDEWEDCNYLVMNTVHYNYKLKLRMLDWDFWSSNDIIADGTDWVWNSGNQQIEYFVHYTALESSTAAIRDNDDNLVEIQTPKQWIN